MKSTKAYKIFERELNELSRFYKASIYAFDTTEKIIKHIKSNKDQQLDIQISNDYNLKKNFRLNLENTLYQQTLIRCISALEIYLIDLIRDIFLKSKEPFKTNQNCIQFSHAELLSIKSLSSIYNKVINKECRNLSSGGFHEILKFYNKRLNINLLNIPPGKIKMEEYHDVRHIIVHKLGRTDARYRAKYNQMNKGGISLNREYLKNCIRDIRRFAFRVNELVISKINEFIIPNNEKVNTERELVILIKLILDDFSVEYLQPSYEFWVNDEFDMLGNILVHKTQISSSELELMLAGSRRQIKSYLNEVKYANKKGKINFTIISDSSVNTTSSGIPRKEITEELIIRVKDELPPQPWEKSIHKIISEKLGLSNSIAYRIINILIKRGIFKDQSNGKIIEEKTRTYKAGNE